MKSEFLRILISNGFTSKDAETCAGIFTVNSLEGVYSHGVNRFSRFVDYVRKGFIKPGAVPELVNKTGSIEQWNGNLAPGPVNALFATGRAMEIAGRSGIALVTLSKTNHWMRAGTYGWHAAGEGYVLIAWTNTISNMPAWGGTDPRLGNNPMVIAVPYKEKAIVLDFAMSQYSYGKMESYRNAGLQLPYPGGFDKNGKLTTDPSEILETWRSLPIGFWKGSGLSLLLDILAAILSGGNSAHEIRKTQIEYALSQVFIALDPRHLANYPLINDSIDRIIADLHGSLPDNQSVVRYPGENIERIRRENQEKGIPVKKSIWLEILNL